MGVSVCALCLREPAVAELPPPRTEGICGRCAARIGQKLGRLASVFENPARKPRPFAAEADDEEPPSLRREEVEKAVAFAPRPDEAEAHLDLAIAYQELGLYEDAREELAFALEHARGPLLQRAVKSLFGKEFGFRGDLARLRDLLFPA